MCNKLRIFDIGLGANKRPQDVDFDTCGMRRKLLLHFWIYGFNFVVELLHIVCRGAISFQNFDSGSNFGKFPENVKDSYFLKF